MGDQGRFQTRIDEQEASAHELSGLAFAGFAHFTALQVRGGRARGLDLHLARLRSASLELFGAALPDELIRERLRDAVTRSPAEISLTATLFSPSGEFTPGNPKETPAVLVRTSEPYNDRIRQLKLAPFPHERALPHIKHVGESAKTYYLRRAVEQGFDDALFVDSRGYISEATIWNIAFWDGEMLTWPRAPHLAGTTMGIVRRQLAALGIPQRDEAVHVDALSSFREAAVMNSWTPGISVSAIAGTRLQSATLRDLLHRAYEKEPWEAI